MTYRYTWICPLCRWINAWTSSSCAHCFRRVPLGDTQERNER